MRASSRSASPRSLRRQSASPTADRKAPSSWPSSPCSLAIAPSIDDRVCRPVHISPGLPLGDEATFERHQVVGGELATAFHAELVLLHDAIVSLILGHRLEGRFRNPHAELGYGFDGARLLVAYRDGELATIGSHGLDDQVVVAGLIAVRRPAPDAGALAGARDDGEVVFARHLIAQGGQLRADLGHR